MEGSGDQVGPRSRVWVQGLVLWLLLCEGVGLACRVQGLRVLAFRMYRSF